jgi:hypothetical protein
MPTQAPAKTEPAPHPSRQLDFYRTRDEFTRMYQPATEEERLLLVQMVRAWLRLQKFYELEAEIMETQGLNALFQNDLERYKIMTRTVAEAERMWRNALADFQRARRRRESHSLESPRRRGLTTVASHRPPAAANGAAPEPDPDSTFRLPLPTPKPS